MKASLLIYKHGHIISRIKPIVSVALLLLYVLAFLFTPLLEHHHHEHHAQECTEQTEIDPCHRLIYHNDENLGCKHEQHLLAEKESCDVCNKILTASPKIINETKEVVLAQYIELLKFNECVERSIIYFKDQSTRAPPANFLV